MITQGELGAIKHNLEAADVQFVDKGGKSGVRLVNSGRTKTAPDFATA